MEVVLIKAAQLILILSIIVILHEGGHFLAAKLFKTKVERFFLFFDVKFALFKKKIGETVYGIGWLPLGGYVKIAGMIDESMDTEQMKSPPQPWEFRSKPAWQRLIIMLAGIIVNLILAIVIFTVLSYKNGETYIDVQKMTQGIVADSAQLAMGLQQGDVPVGVNGTNYNDLKKIYARALIDGGELDVKRGASVVHLPITVDDQVEMLEQKAAFYSPIADILVGEVMPDGGAQKAGLKKGDVFVSVDGMGVSNWSKVSTYLKEKAGKTATFKLKRNDELLEIPVAVNDEGLIGVQLSSDVEKITSKKTFSFGESIAEGVNKTFSLITDQAQSFSMLWKLKGKATKYLSGPIGIAKNLPAKWDWDYFWGFTGMLSAILAFMNILPIPGLDGGHAVFTIYEMITGHKPSDSFMGAMQMVGAVILIGLMVFVFGNDLFNLFF